MNVETCSTPDRGYMGDPRRGASLGRSNRRGEILAAELREDIASWQRTLSQLADPTQAYLFDHLGEGGKQKVAADRQADIAAARLRLERIESAPENPRFHLRRVRLDSGGYDAGGAYWGHGGELYEAFTDDGAEFMIVRIWPDDQAAAFKARGGVQIGQPGYDEFARRFPRWWANGSREAAKDAVSEEYPNARFYR